MIKVQVMSDLHLEFDRRAIATGAGSTVFMPKNHNNADVLVLAGDIHLMHSPMTQWFADVCQKYKLVLYIPGNHEYYNMDFDEVNNDLPRWVKAINGYFSEERLVLLHNSTYMYENVKFIGATLWTDFDLNRESMDYAASGMNDFIIVTKDGKTFKPKDAAEEYYISSTFIEKELQDKKTTNFVITHHLPTYKSVNPRFLKFPYSKLNPAFASQADYLVEQADYWVHGHTHDSSDYYLGDCRVVCNPRGYLEENSNGFQQELVLEV